MKTFEFLKQQFLSTHDFIDDEQYLDKYLNFLINYKLDQNNDSYTEKHHILPRSLFPDFVKCDWNLVELIYEDHRQVHLWLYKAFNIRQYQRPLNKMMKEYKNPEELSRATKRGWENLKQDLEKLSEWKNKRSQHMKKLTTEERSRRSKLRWSRMSDQDREELKQKIKSSWTEEMRKQKSESNKNSPIRNSKEFKDSVKQKLKLRRDNMTDEERLRFKTKMSEVNKREDKRKDASEKIKQKWKTPEFLEKMKNRPKNPGTVLEIIKEDGSILAVGNMRKLSKDYNFSTHFLRKYKDTNQKIIKLHLNNDNMILENCIIRTININK